MLLSDYDEDTIKKFLESSEGLLNKKINDVPKLLFYKTSNFEINNLNEITSNVIFMVKNKKALLIVGNGVDCIYSLVEFEDYIYEKYLGKKIVLFYGNCHTGIVKKYLETSIEFKERYEIYPLKEIQEVDNIAYFDISVMKYCDVFIHQSIWEKNRYGEEYSSENIIKKLNPQCVVIAMPNLYHMPCCLFPQYYDATELRYKKQTYFFRDFIIDEGLKKGYSLKKISIEYYKYNFDSKIIEQEYKDFIEKVRNRECEWDIKVADFIESHIKEIPLFYEMNHPTNFIFKYYAYKLLNILICGKYTIGEVEEYKLDVYQMPLLTVVKDALGLKYSTLNQNIRETGVKVRNVPMDIREYIKEYFSVIWICDDFKVEQRIRSKVCYYIYKIQDLFLKK